MEVRKEVMHEFSLSEKYQGEEFWEYFENIIDTIHTLAEQGFMEDAERQSRRYFAATQLGQ